MAPALPHTTDPNRFAGSVETAGLREHIALDEDLLARLDVRVARNNAAVHRAERTLAEALDNLSSTQNLHNKVLAEHDAVCQRLLESRGLLHPIRRLPLEILSNIFMAHLTAVATSDQYEDGSDAQLRHLSMLPYMVSQVSRKWRAAALYTPRLWTYISVRFPKPSIVPYDLAWVSGLEERIRRSGALSIHLHVHGYFPHDPAKDLPPEWPYFITRGILSHEELWAPMINAIPRCHSITVSTYDEFLDFSSHTADLFKQDAPRLENLCVRIENIKPQPDPDEDVPYSPGLHFNMHAPNLQSLEFLRVRLPAFDLRGAKSYPCVTSARLCLVDDEPGDDIRALLQRCPALARVDVDLHAGHADPVSALAWLSHPTLEHITLQTDYVLHHSTLPGPDVFPRLESVDIQRRSSVATLTRAFLAAATGPFHATRRLSLSLEYLDQDTVSVVDLLTRLDTLHIRGGILTPAFFDIGNAWHRPSPTSGAWRCPLLYDVSLTEVQEVHPVGRDVILALLRERNATAKDGPHAGFQRFRLEWAAEHAASLDDSEGFEEKIQAALMG